MVVCFTLNNWRRLWKPSKKSRGKLKNLPAYLLKSVTFAQRLKEQQDKIKGTLLDYCKEQGVESVKTGSGMFYRSVKTRYWTSDWEAMHAFIKEKDLPEFMEKRLNQTAVREYLEDNPDAMPEGLTIDSEYQLSVRKK